MVHKCRIISNVPVNAISRRIVEGLIFGLSPILQPTWTIVVHAEEIDIPGRSIALTTNAEVMGVPGLGPLLRVSVDVVEEEVVQQPDMCRHLGVEAMVNFEVGEELLPLLPETMCDIVPQPLDTCVVDAPSDDELILDRITATRIYLPQIYDPRPPPRASSMNAATRTFSVP
jgi:hypothetical protein